MRENAAFYEASGELVTFSTSSGASRHLPLKGKAFAAPEKNKFYRQPKAPLVQGSLSAVAFFACCAFRGNFLSDHPDWANGAFEWEMPVILYKKQR